VPDTSLDRPAIDYTDKDFESLRQALLSLATYRLPEWTDRSPSDVGMLLVDLFAYVGDVVSYYQDRIASESFLATAVERRSVLNLLRLIGYELAPPVAASAELTLVFNPPGPGEPTVVTVPHGADFASKATDATPAQEFVYLGADRQIDLAGPEVTPGADGKLAFAGLPVRHGRAVTGEILGSSTGEPNQSFVLASAPVIPETLTVEVDEGAGPVEWQRRQNLLYHVGAGGAIETSGADARDYYLQYDEEGRAAVVFGDGEYGRRPPIGRDNVRASYLSGGGAVGNVAAGAIAEAKAKIEKLASVTNPLPAVGGADAEPLERARRFGPLAFRSGDRAVTLGDYVAIALQAGGVAKVRARTTGWNRVDLYVAPEGEECTAAPDELKRRLVAHFETRRMIGTSVHIQDPVCVPVDVSVELVTEHNYPPETTRQRAEQAVADLLAFRNVDFGRALYVSKIYEAVEAIDGVYAATVTRFRRRDQAPPRTLRRKVLVDAGLAEVSALVERAYAGDIAVEGRIDVGEVEIPVPGTISVTVSYEAP
jgi:Baseplate J-like protein